MEANAQPYGDKPLQQSPRDDVYIIQWQNIRALSLAVASHPPDEVRDDDTIHYKQQPRPTTRSLTRLGTCPTRSTTRSERSPPVIRRARLGKNTPSSLTQPSKISKPTVASRRSVRIAEREQRLSPKVTHKTVMPNGVEDTNMVQMLIPLKKAKPKTKLLTRALTRKNTHLMERHPPTSSKPQGITKRMGRSRPRKLEA